MVLRKRQVSMEAPASGARPHPGVQSIELLSQELASADTATRRQAVRDMAASPDAMPLLCARLLDESSASVRSMIFTALVAHPSSRVVEGLLPLLRSEDVGLRNSAVDALQKMPTEVTPHMELLLTDADSDVRIMAVNVLGLLQHPSAPALLLSVAAEDPHVNVCAAALDALAEVGELSAIPILESVGRRFADVAFIQFAVATAIRRIRGG
jgi:HEAT repeat protein